MLRFGICDVDIFAYDTECFSITAGSKYPVRHLFCLFLQTMLPQSLGSNTQQIKNIPICSDQRAVRFIWQRFRCFYKSA